MHLHLLLVDICVLKLDEWVELRFCIKRFRYSAVVLIGTNPIHGEKHNISCWVFENMSKFTEHSRIEFEKFMEILCAFFTVI